MDSKFHLYKICNEKIWTVLREEYDNTPIFEIIDETKWFNGSYKHQSHPEFMWKSFVKKKRLGCVCVSLFNNLYKITNEKKWFMSKLKYGF